MRGVEVVGVVVRHRPDDRQLVGIRRARPRQVLADRGCPATFVAIGLNSPRMPSGASGFMSNESRWLSPPVRKTRIIDFARGRPGRRRPGRPPGAPSRPGSAQAREGREPDLEELAADDADRASMLRGHPGLRDRSICRGRAPRRGG